MKIGIDLSPAEKDPAGIGQYSISLFTELGKLDKKNEYFVYSSAPFMFSNAENVTLKVNSKLPFSGIRWMYRVSADAKMRNLDLFISPSNHLFTKLFPKTLQFVHDLAPIHYPQYFGKKASMKYRGTLKTAMKDAYKVITISKTVREELAENYNLELNDIEFIYPGLNSWVKTKHKDPQSVLDKYNLDFDYILTLSTLEPRKNHENMLRAFKTFKTKTLSPLKFVIIGKKGWYYEPIFKLVDELDLIEDVVFLGYVPNQELSPIYEKAKAFMFLSHYEGFGIPPIEAMSLDIPTLVSDIPVFHEAYEDKAFYTNPNNSDKIATSLDEILEKKPKNTSEFILKKYSWEKSASKLLKIINEA